MASIKITKFAGESPSTSARALGADRAAVALNLYSRSDEFRPLKSDLEVFALGASNPKTLFRYERNADKSINTTMTNGWIASADWVSHAKGQINDDKTDRTYMTFAPDGFGAIQAPHVGDCTGAYKTLGLPAPAKPTLRILLNDEYTPEERDADIKAAWSEVAAVVKTYRTVNEKTGPYAQDLTHGYADSAVGSQDRFYDIAGKRSLIAGTTSWEAFSDWVSNLATLSQTQTIGSTPTAVMALRFRAYYTSCTFPTDITAFSAALKAIKIRGKTLFTDTQILDFIFRLKDSVSLTGAVQPMVTKFTNSVVELRALIDGKREANTPAQSAAFYAKTDVIAIINTAIDAFAGKLARVSNQYVLDNGLSGTAYGFLWAGGDEASVKGGLVSQVTAAFKTRDDGSKSLDLFSFGGAISQLSGTNIGLPPFPWDEASNFAALRSEIDPGRWQSYAGYPGLYANSGEQQASSIVTKMRDVAVDAEALDRYFAEFVEAGETLRNSVSIFFDDAAVIKNLPETTTRLPDTRFYVTTWVTNWGEESPPSPPSDMVEVDQNDVCVVTRDPTVPAGLGIVGWRLYRSNAGTVGSDFQMVGDLALIAEKNPLETNRRKVVEAVYLEIGRKGTMANVTDAEIDYWAITWVPSTAPGALPVNQQLRSAMISAALATTDGVFESEVVRAIAGALQGVNSLKTGEYFSSFSTTMTYYNDAVNAAQLGDVLATATWLPPPVNLQGLTSMANGIMAGFFDNILCFSEAYVPYAWPVDYQIPVEHLIVGIAAFGNTLLVSTNNSAYLVSGSDPASMSAPVLSGGQACVSARSMVSVDNGVVYASTYGLCEASLNGVKVITEGLFSREDWNALNPSSILSAHHDGVYYFMYDTGVVQGCYSLDLATGKLNKIAISGSAFYRDTRTDTLYIASANKVYAVFSGSTFRTGKYRTGIAKFSVYPSFAWMQVDADWLSNVVVKWYGDGVLRYTATLTNSDPVRLPAGIYKENELEIETTSRITSVIMASSTEELVNG